MLKLTVYNKSVAAILVFWSIIYECRAAQNVNDSLLSLLQNDIVDTQRVDIYNKLSYLNDLDTAMVKTYSAKAIELGIEISYGKGLSDAYSNLGWTFLQKGNYLRSKINWQKALENSERANLLLEQGKAHNGLALLAEAQGDYNKALKHQFNALKILSNVDYEAGLSAVYGNIGSVYVHQNRFDKALEYHEKSLAIDKKLNNKSGMAYTFNNIGNIYAKKGNSTKALGYLKDALKLKRNFCSEVDLASTYNNIGANFLAIEDFDSALYYNGLAVLIYEKNKILNKLAIPLIDVGKVYQKLGDFEEAEKFLNRGVILSNKLGQLETLRDGLEAQAKLFANKGLYNSAFTKYVEFKAISDSLLKNSMDEKTNRIEAEYSFSLERDSIELANRVEKTMLEKDILYKEKIKRISLLGMAVAIILMLFLIRSNKKKSTTNKLLVEQTGALEKSKAENEEKNAELEKLNSVKDRLFSIIAHDLKSPIASLQGLLSISKTSNDLSDKDLKLYINRLAKNVEGIAELMDNLLHWASAQMQGDVVKNPESLMLNENINKVVVLLAETAKLKNLDVQVNVQEEHKVYADKEILSFLMRNLLINAFKFSNKGGIIMVESKMLDDVVKVSVIDKGIGMDNQTQQSLFNGFVESTLGTKAEKGTGLGLMLCKEFIEQSGGQIGVNSELGTGSEFWFILPQNDYN